MQSRTQRQAIGIRPSTALLDRRARKVRIAVNHLKQELGRVGDGGQESVDRSSSSSTHLDCDTFTLKQCARYRRLTERGGAGDRHSACLSPEEKPIVIDNSN